LAVPVLTIGPQDFKSEFSLEQHYTHAHAYGNCLQVVDSTIAAVDLEFGPEIQGYPQSWLQLRIEYGEGFYVTPGKNESEGEDEAPTYTLIYHHTRADEISGVPQVEMWTAGQSGGWELHQLSARWVSSVPGHHLQLYNKSIVESAGGAVEPLNLGFDLDLLLAGGPATPTQDFCATVSGQDRCDLLDCGSSMTIYSITDASICTGDADSICVLETSSVQLQDNEARTYVDPAQPDRYVAVQASPWGDSAVTVPKNWTPCQPGMNEWPACDCSCAGAGCRATRLRDELIACDEARPCADVGDAFPADGAWNDEQICLFEHLRDHVPGYYRVAVNLGDPDFDVHIHVLGDGSVIQTVGSCDHGVFPGCDTARVWSYPSQCQLTNAAFFDACLAAPSESCFEKLWTPGVDDPIFESCERISEVTCRW
jgi:hypothetical protein